MGIDDNVRLNPAFTEWHIDSRPFLRTDTLLPVTGREFIANDRGSRYSEGDLNFLQLRIPGITTWWQNMRSGRGRNMNDLT